MRNLAKLLCIVILLAIPAVVLAQRSSGSNFYYDDGSAIIGQITSIDKRQESLQIYDSSRHRYTVLANRATIYDGSKKRSFGDLKTDGMIRVYGRDNGRSTIDARTIEWLGNEKDYRGGFGTVRVYGVIRDVNTRDRQITLYAEGRTERVHTSDMTDITLRGRRIDLRDLRKGDSMSVQGYRDRRNEIVADVITASGEYDYRTTGRGDVLEGRVVRETGTFDRTLRIEANSRDRRSDDTVEIDVDKSAQIYRNGRTISVHDINKGETVRVEGSWSGSTFEATRVEVGGSWDGYGRDSRSVGGKIKEIDYRNHEFRIDSRYGEMRIFCDRARIWNGSRERDFEDLHKGDEVRVSGTVRGSQIDADRVDTGSSSGYWLDRDSR